MFPTSLISRGCPKRRGEHTELVRTQGSTRFYSTFQGVSAVTCMKLMFHPCVRDTLEPSAHRYNTHTSHPDDTCDVFEWPAEFQVKRRRYDARAEARSDDRASYKKNRNRDRKCENSITSKNDKTYAYGVHPKLALCQ